MLALRYAGLLALTVWVGGLLVLGVIVAPAIFDVLAARRCETRCWRGRSSAKPCAAFIC